MQQDTHDQHADDDENVAALTVLAANHMSRKDFTYHVFCMSMNGDTCSAFGTLWPRGSNKNDTRAPQGVFVTSAMHLSRLPSCLQQ